MDDDIDLINYCEIHCESERALFKGAHINRMLILAGSPEGFVKSVPPDSFISVHDEMKRLCRLARDRLDRIPIKKSSAQLYDLGAYRNAKGV